jgi:hypothetical protein
VRADIEAAYQALDSKGQAAITGMKAPKQVKKALEQLGAFIGDEEVLALACGRDLGPSLGEQRSMGKAASAGAIMSTARSARLLVLTENNFYQVQGGGFMTGGQPQGTRIALADVRDVRVRTTRSSAKMFGKERVLMVDYLRGGAQLETEVCELAEDSQLEILVRRLQEQVASVQEQQAIAVQVSSVQVSASGGVSVADELAKLAQLRDSGVLSEDEFNAQKTKLLQS